MRLSQLATSIPPSATVKLNTTARALKQKGEPLIHLGGGEPENKTPQSAVDAAMAMLVSGKNKYTPTTGTPSLKNAVIQYTAENYGRQVTPANVIVSAGAKHAVFNLLYSLLDPGDEVIILAPYWVSYPEMVRMVRGVPVIVPPPGGEYQPSLAAIEKAITPATKLILLNNPNNPSGTVYDEGLIASLVELCERREIFLVSDDIYHQLVFDGRTPPNICKFTNRDVETSYVILVNGISKLYGMTGFRIGWTVAPKQIVDVMANIQMQSTTCNPTVDQAAAEGALLGSQEVVKVLRANLERNRDIMLEQLAASPAIKVTKPGGSFYCLPDFSAFQKDSVALSSLLLEKALVAAVPGKEFGMEGHLRLSYCGDTEDIIEGVQRIRWALDPAAPREITIGGKKMVRDWL